MYSNIERRGMVYICTGRINVKSPEPIAIRSKNTRRKRTQFLPSSKHWAKLMSEISYWHQYTIELWLQGSTLQVNKIRSKPWIANNFNEFVEIFELFGSNMFLRGPGGRWFLTIITSRKSRDTFHLNVCICVSKIVTSYPWTLLVCLKIILDIS